MKNSLNPDSIDIQTAVSHYIKTIEALYEAIKERQKRSNDPSYSVSLQNVRQILQQMQNIKERGFSSYHLAEALQSDYLDYFHDRNHVVAEEIPTPFLPYKNANNRKQINNIQKAIFKLPTQESTSKKSTNQGSPSPHTSAPPIWKPERMDEED